MTDLSFFSVQSAFYVPRRGTSSAPAQFRVLFFVLYMHEFDLFCDSMLVNSSFKKYRNVKIPNAISIELLAQESFFMFFLFSSAPLFLFFYFFISDAMFYHWIMYALRTNGNLKTCNFTLYLWSKQINFQMENCIFTNCFWIWGKWA